MSDAIIECKNFCGEGRAYLNLYQYNYTVFLSYLLFIFDVLCYAYMQTQNWGIQNQYKNNHDKLNDATMSDLIFIDFLLFFIIPLFAIIGMYIVYIYIELFKIYYVYIRITNINCLITPIHIFVFTNELI